MKRCIDCKNYGVSCNKHSSMTINDDCENADWKKPTNYERIKNMSIDEMAAYHARNISCDRCEARPMCKAKHTDKDFMKLNCVDRFKLWLESEVE